MILSLISDQHANLTAVAVLLRTSVSVLFMGTVSILGL